MTSYEEVATWWGLGAPHRVWADRFADSAHLSAAVTAWLRQPDRVRSATSLLSLGTGATDHVLAVTGRLGADPGQLAMVARLVAHLRHILVDDPVAPAKASAAMPALTAPIRLAANAGDVAELVYLLAYLSGAAILRERYAALGLSDEAVTTTLADFGLRVDLHHRHHGCWGLPPTPWHQNFATQRIFGVGRLQYMPSTFHWPYRVHRHRSSGEITVVATAGQQVSGDGHLLDAAGRSEQGCWETSLTTRGSLVIAHPVDPLRGTVARATVHLDGPEWSVVLSPGDPVLDVHIPASGPLDPAACRASLQQVDEVCRGLVRPIDHAALTCSTWLMDPQFADTAMAGSNLVAFTRLFHAVSLPGADDRQLFERVFGCEPTDPATLPTDTRLRQVVVDHLQRGGRWRRGAGLIPRGTLGPTIN